LYNHNIDRICGMETGTKGIKEHIYFVNGNNAFWCLVLLIIIMLLCSYKMGVYAEKIGWLEDQALEQIEGLNADG